MKKTVVIHQPDFIPYLGFFHRLLYTDLFIILDDVQFVKSNNSWTHRDKIKTRSGAKWLTISVDKAFRDTPINQITISDSIDWKKQHLDLLIENYKKTPFFHEIFPYLEALYSHHFEKMMDFNIASIKMLLELFKIDIKIQYSSNLKTSKTKSERLAELLIQVEATHYLSGVGAKAYHDDEPFNKAGIEVVWQDFRHPVYPQLHGEFIPYLSSIDLLFNCGIEKSREILRSC